MARMGFDTPTYAPDGKDYDSTHIGGYAGRTDGSRDANGQVRKTGDGRQDTVDRYRGLGDAAAARQAYQADFSKAQADEAQGLESRNRQRDALGMMRQAANGNAPSRAGILGNQAAGQSLDATLGASAGARGGMGVAAAQAHAMRGQGGMQQQAVQHFSGMRAGEMNDARSQYGSGAGAMRAGDYTQQGLAQQRAEAQGQAEMDQRSRNDALQAGYEGMAFDVNDAELQRGLAQKEIFAKRFGTASAKQERDAAGNDRMFGAFVGSMGGATGAMASSDGSDERMKERVVPLVNEADAGVEQRWDREVKPAPAMTDGGASFGAPIPKYNSMGEAAAARPEAPPAPPAAPKQAQPRKLSDAELKKLGEEMLASQGAKTKASLDDGPAIRDRDPMGAALASGLKPFEYEYRPEHRGSEHQMAGEKNVGPMAQDMASNPVTGTAVTQGDDGLLYIDNQKALKLSLGGIGYLAAKQQEQEADLERLKGRG